MPKILLVEDDNNLREIYGARLMAEGFEIISAADGEEALALAVKQKPDLIISDVMMPKISGFDMLDILRTTPDTKQTKVIMMTALSQPEDRERGEALGADKYLVKSQVTLEDVVTAVHEVLEDGQATAQPADEPDDSDDSADSQATEDNKPDAPVPDAKPTEKSTSNPSPPPVENSPKDANPEPAPNDSPTKDQPDTEAGPPEDPTQAPDNSEEPDPTDDDEPFERKKKIIKPINDLHAKPDILKLAEKEQLLENQANGAAESASESTETPVLNKAGTDASESIAQEKKELQEQVNDFVTNSDMVNGEPPMQVEPKEDPEVGDAEYNPPVADSDVVQIGDPPSDDDDIQLPKPPPVAPTPQPPAVVTTPADLPQPPPKQQAEPKPTPQQPKVEEPAVSVPKKPTQAQEPASAETSAEITEPTTVSSEPSNKTDTPIPKAATSGIKPEDVAL